MSDMTGALQHGSVYRHRPLDALTISNHAATAVRWAARIWVVLAAIGFLGLTLRNGVPTNPELGAWQQPAQLALLVLVTLGGLIAWKWEILGAMILAFGAIFLGVLATVEHDPRNSFLAAAVFLIPAILTWFVWQRTRPLKVVAAIAMTMVLLVASGGYASAYVYDYLFGPTHPVSATQAPEVDVVEWIWSGGATAKSINVTAKLAEKYDVVRLAVSETSDMQNPVIADALYTLNDGDRRIVSFTVAGLSPNTKYFYAVEADGHLDLARQGQFTTFPDGPASFSFAFAACARTDSNGVVFDAIREAEPLFYLNDGDLHYTYIDVDDPNRFREEFDNVLAQPAQAALYRSVPIAYVWDDHDFGPNNGNRTSPTQAVARQVYQEYVPHYDLAAGEGNVPIYQSFTVGRALFLLTDTRSERDPDDAVDDANKSMLGEEQKAWFKQQLLDAKGKYPVIFWINSGPWIDEAAPGKDTWGGFTTERRELADFIAENEISGLAMLSGDAHMIAADDGTNSDFSSSGDGGFPVLHAGPLDKRGGVKGGPYSEGTSAASGQFGLITVEDSGGESVTVTFSGRNYKGDEVLSYTFTVPATAS
jgi:hypothetical protein